MHAFDRMMTNICSELLEESKNFYTQLFDFRVAYDSDWFVHLTSKDGPLELGIVKRSHDIVPEEAREAAAGLYLTFVVEEADAVFEKAKAARLEVISEPKDTFYGQRRLLLRDPNGVVIDVSSPIPDLQP
jgi:predicted enzyme related to lactoylglutathione lyase